MKLKSLSILTACLFVLSLGVYVQKNRRGADLVAGSDFIKGLDVNAIHKIKLGFKGGKSLVFEREGGRFVVANHKGYPASNAKINDLIFKIANLQVKEIVASSADKDDLERFELNTEKRHYLVEIFDNDGNKAVGFAVGKNRGGSRYLMKEGEKKIYLSAGALWLDSSRENFIKRILVEINKSEIARVSVLSDKLVEFEVADDRFVLKRPEGLKAKIERLKKYVSSLGEIRFEEFYKYNDPKVFGLKYKETRIKLKNDLVYKLELAKKGEERFLKVSALLDEMPKQFSIAKDDGADKLQSIEEVVKAQGQAQRFNLENAGWVYKIKKKLYDELLKNSSYFLDS